jgi:hypothetical protein
MQRSFEVKKNAPVISQHIPPIEISSGSVIVPASGRAQDSFQDHVVLQTRDPFNDPTGPASVVYNYVHVFPDNRQITRVRVVNTDGSIMADMAAMNESIATAGITIQLWVNNTDGEHHMVLETEGPNRPLQLKIRDRRHRFEKDVSGGATGREKKRFKCYEPKTRLIKAHVSKHNGDTIVVSTDEGNEREIDRILIWTKMASSHQPE